MDGLRGRLENCNHDIKEVNKVLETSGSYEPMSYEEIGDVLGMTPERIKRIEAQALRKLRSPKLGMALRSFLRDSKDIVGDLL